MILARAMKLLMNVYVLEPRDRISVEIKSSISNSTVNNTQNNAISKFEVINNAKNENVAMGDNSNQTADFHSFGDKNMLNPTENNTGGWNTKNRGTNLTASQKKSRARRQKPLAQEKKKRVRKLLATGTSEHAKLKINTTGTTAWVLERPILHVANLLDTATLLGNVCLGGSGKHKFTWWNVNCSTLSKSVAKNAAKIYIE
jgi:hypothetical protein